MCVMIDTGDPHPLPGTATDSILPPKTNHPLTPMAAGGWGPACPIDSCGGATAGLQRLSGFSEIDSTIWPVWLSLRMRVATSAWAMIPVTLPWASTTGMRRT